MEIPQEVQQLVATGPLAHLTTLNADGSPQVSVVWVGIEDGEFVLGHMGAWKKVRNIRGDGRVALSFLGTEDNEMGLRQYVVAYGNARITEGGAADLLQRLAHIYMGPEVVFPPEPYRNAPGFITRIKPERITGIGPWSPEQK